MTSFARYYKNRKLVDVSMTEMEGLITDESNQKIIAEHVYERLYTRFLKIFDFSSNDSVKYERSGIIESRNIFNEEYKNGFLIMTSCSLLIETFASFLIGQNLTPGRQSVSMFIKVFEYAESKNNDLGQFKSTPFYGKIRCGLLHQGETYGKFKITRQGLKLLDGETIDAILFFKNVKSLLQVYQKELSEGSWDSAEWDACRLKIRYIINNSK